LIDRFRHNNFDLLRFLFAGTVMLEHAYVLSQRPELAFLDDWLSSEVAVRAFFVVSGLLVFMSWDRTRDLARYAEKRARRIYPAYFTVVVACALLLCLVSAQGLSAYFGADWLKYLAANLTFLNFLAPTLPGVFDGNEFREVNGALWTLKVEVMFYLAVPLVAWLFDRLGRLRVMVALYVLSVLYAWGCAQLAAGGSTVWGMLGRQLPGQLCYFMVGALWYYYLGFFERHAWKLAAAAAALAVLHRFLPVAALEPLWLGTLVVYFGFFFYAGNFGRYGDFSYGIYILHFPIIQVLVFFGVFAWSPFGGVAIAAAAVLSAAVLLWHLVERPFLARSSHYVGVATPVR
jgi:peptidoglycan/LPS O-acetylase OafA/YrhL